LGNNRAIENKRLQKVFLQTVCALSAEKSFLQATKYQKIKL